MERPYKIASGTVVAAATAAIRVFRGDEGAIAGHRMIVMQTQETACGSCLGYHSVIRATIRELNTSKTRPKSSTRSGRSFSREAHHARANDAASPIKVST